MTIALHADINLYNKYVSNLLPWRTRRQVRYQLHKQGSHNLAIGISFIFELECYLKMLLIIIRSYDIEI